MLKLATASERTGDRKLAACPVHTDCKLPCKSGHSVSATFASQNSCPETCPFYHSGCYAEAGNVGFVTHRLNKAADTLEADQWDTARAEADVIDGLSGKNPLRLHVVGDCSTNETAAIVSNAALRYSAKHDQPVWTYTHAWANVQRESWQSVSVLASCETDNDVVEATKRNYAVAVVRPHADLPKTIGGLKAIKCPQQTGAKLDCFDCKLCTKDGLLRNKAVIVFDPHGVSKKRVIRALELKGV